MYHVSAQGVDERMINVHYYYYYYVCINEKRPKCVFVNIPHMKVVLVSLL